MFGKVAADREHGLHPLRGRPQRRIGYREVAPAKRLVEPLCVTDFLSRETAVEIRLGRLLKALPSQKLGYVLPDERLGWHTPSPLEGWVHPLKPVSSRTPFGPGIPPVCARSSRARRRRPGLGVRRRPLRREARARGCRPSESTPSRKVCGFRSRSSLPQPVR